jgi:hypothetical protein
MPGDGLLWADTASLLGSQLTRAVVNGSVPIDRLDDMVLRIVARYVPSCFPCSGLRLISEPPIVGTSSSKTTHHIHAQTSLVGSDRPRALPMSGWG